MRSAELILILLSTLAISATLAQRSGRRFRPIGRREPEEQPLEDPVPLEEEQPELAKPRFTPTIRKLGTFRPSGSPASKQDVEPQKQSFQINSEPVQEQPRIAPNRRSGGRGSRNFIESINAGAAGLRTDQLEKLKTTGILSGGTTARRPSSRPQNTVQRQSSRTQRIRPVAPVENENVKVETETPSFKSKPSQFKPLSRPKQKLQPKPISDAEPLEPLPAPTKEVDDAPIEGSETSKQSLRRERIKQLKNRKSSGNVKKSKMMVDKPTEEVSLNPAEDVSVVLTELESVDEKPKKKEVKLDSNVSKPLEQTIRDTSTDEVTIAEQMMKAEKSESNVKMDKSKKVDSKLTPETSSQEPSTTKTTEASDTPSTTISPTTTATPSRRISQLTRVRPERTRTRGSGAVTRTRGSAAVTRTRGSGTVSRTRGSGTVSHTRGSSPAEVTVQEGTTTPAPRLSGRRGGRGNSRGGAALVTKNMRVGGTRSFTPRVSSRNRVNPALNAESSDAAETTQPANRRSHSRSLPMTRRKLPSLSARFARVKKTRKLPEGHELTENTNKPEEQDEETATESISKDNASQRPNLRNRMKLRNRAGRGRATTTPTSKTEKDNTRPSPRPSPRYVRFRNNRKNEVKEKVDVKDENKPIRKPFKRIQVTSRRVDSSPLSSRPNRFSLRRKLTRGGSTPRSQETPSENNSDLSSRKELKTTTESAHKRVVENKLDEERSQSSEVSTTEVSTSTDSLPNVQDAATTTAISEPVQQVIVNPPLKGITEKTILEIDSELKSDNREGTTIEPENLESKPIADSDRSEEPNPQESTPMVEMTTEQQEMKIEIATEGTFSLNTNGVKSIPTITAKRITIKPSVTELENENLPENNPTTEETQSITPVNTFSNRGTVTASTSRRRERIPLRKTTRGSIRTPPRRKMDAVSQAKDDVVTDETEAPIFPLEKGPVMAIEDKEIVQEYRDESSTKRRPKQRNEVAINPPEQFVLKVAPEDPRDAINRGGLKFRPHDDSERDLKRSRNGDVIVTQIGTLENTPSHQVQSILSGLGGRRRGLARPPKKQRITTTTTEDPKYLDYNIEDYYIYDDY